MKLLLSYRRFGVHHAIKEIEIDGTFRKYGKLNNGMYEIDEEKLINSLPNNFLPTTPDKILVLVADSEYGSTAVCNLKTFRDWSKYHFSHSLTLKKYDR
jgi:hypothetical protein